MMSKDAWQKLPLPTARYSSSSCKASSTSALNAGMVGMMIASLKEIWSSLSKRG